MPIASRRWKLARSGKAPCSKVNSIFSLRSRNKIGMFSPSQLIIMMMKKVIIIIINNDDEMTLIVGVSAALAISNNTHVHCHGS